MSDNIVYVVHCIDTEGTLHETLEATFGRLKSIFGIDLEPHPATLKKLQQCQIDLGGMETEVAKVFSSELLGYLDTWDKIDNMLYKIMSTEFRNEVTDSFGNGWVYNWHTLDHVGFDNNPRRRDMGHHQIFDHYASMMRITGSTMDGLHFHHHPVGFTRQAHLPASNYLSNDPVIFQILARKIIERNWFPCVYRPGFHLTRPDSHWFLEQYIPFEYANQSKLEKNGSESQQRDLADGRLGDWRRATTSWTPYHPSHDDYQVAGDCRRVIGKCLNIGTRIRLLDEEDVVQAFEEAQQGKPVILSVTNHDFRDITQDIKDTRALIKAVSKDYPEVKFKFSEGRAAMRAVMRVPKQDPLKFTVEFEENRMTVTASHKTFGPQPFLALKTLDGRFIHDNFDFQQPFIKWTYVFDQMTVPLNALDNIGIASCDIAGNVTVHTYDMVNKREQAFSY